MSQYLIDGGKKLTGRISISGNKNSILPCLAAAILSEEDIILHNVPNISDVRVFSEILESLGAKVSRDKDTIIVNCRNLHRSSLGPDEMKKLRASIVLVGALLSKFHKAEFFHPGGDVIGRRDIDQHIIGFEKLGYKVFQKDLHYKAFQKDRNKDVKIFLEIATVTGTENLLLVAVKRHGVTIIRNAASEPHVVDLCNLLVLMGAKISGIGTSTLIIEGVSSLHGVEFTIGSDYMEFGTYAIAAAVTRGEVEITNCYNLDLEPIIWPMQKMGVSINQGKDTVVVSAKKIIAIPKLITNVWPGFPTDLMSVMIVLATQAEGISLLHDWIYESRMFFVDKLISMGANIFIADTHRVIISGPSKLYGRNVETPDIRAGMALVLAALVAEGKSIINRAELIERGYEDVVSKLTSLGASIESI